MSSEARTERGQFVFKVKEGVSHAYVAAEELTSFTTTVVGKDSHLHFDLNVGTIEEAEMVAAFLNEHIRNVCFTVFRGHPMFHHKPAK